MLGRTPSLEAQGASLVDEWGSQVKDNEDAQGVRGGPGLRGVGTKCHVGVF